MSTTAVNWDFTIAAKVKSIIKAITSVKIDAVTIVPGGAERHRPSEAARRWVNISVIDNGIEIESSAYIGLTTLQITCGVESLGKPEGTAEAITELATTVLHEIATTALSAGYNRQLPKPEPTGYSGGEDNSSVYWHEFTAEYEHQVEKDEE